MKVLRRSKDKAASDDTLEDDTGAKPRSKLPTASKLLPKMLLTPMWLPLNVARIKYCH